MDPHGKPVEGTPKNWLQYYISESNNNIEGKEQAHPGIQEVKPVEIIEKVSNPAIKDDSENINLKKRTAEEQKPAKKPTKKVESTVEEESEEEVKPAKSKAKQAKKQVVEEEEEEVKPKKKTKVAKKPKSDTEEVEEAEEEEVVKPKKKAKVVTKKPKHESEDEED